MIAVAATAAIVATAGSAAGCSTTSPTLSPPRSTPTTLEQLCDAQTWPRPVPNIVGQLLKPGTKVGALECWDNVRGVAPDGHDPVNNPAKPVEATYRITAASPLPGTSIGRHDVVTIQLAAVDPKAAPASRPCDWVTISEAAGFLGGPVTARPSGDEAGSVDMSCDYDRSGEIGKGIRSDLLVAGAFPVDAASEFALWATENVTTVGGLGVKAACVFQPRNDAAVHHAACPAERRPSLQGHRWVRVLRHA
jgi:hypothetical protein